MFYGEKSNSLGNKLECTRDDEPHQWQSGTVRKAFRREVSGSNTGRACRHSRLEFSVVFSETHLYTSYESLERPPRRVLPLLVLVPQADN